MILEFTLIQCLPVMLTTAAAQGVDMQVVHDREQPGAQHGEHRLDQEQHHQHPGRGRHRRSAAEAQPQADQAEPLGLGLVEDGLRWRCLFDAPVIHDDDLVGGRGTNELYAWTFDPTQGGQFGVFVDATGQFANNDGGGLMLDYYAAGSYLHSTLDVTETDFGEAGTSKMVLECDSQQSCMPSGGPLVKVIPGSKDRTLFAVSSAERMPSTVVMAMISISGEASIMQMARKSSIPPSVSTITW